MAALTPREREVFELAATGEPNKVIVRRLGISLRTVELHRADIVEKLQAGSLSDLIRGDNHQLQPDYIIPLRRSLGADIVPRPLTARSRPTDTADPKDGRLCRVLTG